MLSIDKQKIYYWSDLEIPIIDFLEELASNEITFTRKLFNKFNQTSKYWYKILDGKEITDIRSFRDFFNINREKIIEAYCCSWFANKIDNLGLIKTITKNVLGEEIFNQYENDDQICSFLLFQNNRENLKNIYYEHFIQKINVKSYLAETELKDINLTKEIAQNILNNFERQNRRKRQKSIIWWFKEDDTSWSMIFRRSRLKGISIKQVHHNLFLKTADLKYFRIFKNLKRLDIYTNKEPLKMLKCARFLIYKISDSDIVYRKQERLLETNKIVELINNLIKNKDLKILEIEMRNVPIASNPTMIIKSEGETGIYEAIQELKDKAIFPNEKDCMSIKIKYLGKLCQIKFLKIGDQTGLSIVQRGLPQNEREEIIELINKLI